MSDANTLALARDLDAALTRLLDASLSAPQVERFDAAGLADIAARLTTLRATVAPTPLAPPCRLDVVSHPGGLPQWGWQITRGADLLAFCDRLYSTSTEARDAGLKHADERGLPLVVITLVPASALRRREALAA